MFRGINMLREAGAEFFLHCGDIGTEPCIDLLAGLAGAFVWGNTDWNRQALQRYAEQIGVKCSGVMGEFTFDDKHLVMIHGDDVTLKRKLLAEQRHDYLLQGHTHARGDERIGRVRIINPGALHRAAEKSVAVLDTRSDALRFIAVS